MLIKKRYISLFLLFIATILVVAVQAQNKYKKSLLERAHLKRNIQRSQELLNRTIHQKENNYNYLQSLHHQLLNRFRLIDGLNTELRVLNDSIAFIETKIRLLDQDIDSMKKEFSEVLYQSLKAKNRHDQLNFILASKSFNEAWRKRSLLKKMARYRRIKLMAIVNKQEKSKKELSQLIGVKTKKSVLFNQKTEELVYLENTQQKERNIRNRLRGEETRLIRSLRKRERQLGQLDRTIEQIIRNGEDGSVSDTTDQKDSRDYQNLELHFVQNKGHLPWPVRDYLVSQSFGIVQHPDLKHITTKNNGIDLLVVPNSKVRSVFDGQIVRVMNISGLGTTILIKHDRFYTVYANLERIFVSKNQEVFAGDELGVLAGGLDLVEFHFEIWEGTKKHNPEKWLK